jgi:hypothetical protein
MSEVADNLRREISEAKTVQAGAKALIGSLRTRVDAAIAELAAKNQESQELNALSEDLSASTDDLATALVEGTVAEGETPA